MGCARAAVLLNLLLFLSSAGCQNDTIVIVRLEGKETESLHSRIVEFYDFGSYEEILFFTSLLLKNNTQDNKGPFEVGLVGPTHSDSAYGVAQLIQKSGSRLKHLYTSFLPTALEFEVSGMNTHRILPPIDLLADATVALIKHIGWSTTLTFYQDTDADMKYLFAHYRAVLHTAHLDHFIFNGMRSFISTGVLGRPRKLRAAEMQELVLRSSSRVFVLMLDGEWARSLICLAFNLKMVYPTYQWVILKISLEEILSSVDGAECSTEELAEVLENAMFVGSHFKSSISVYKYGIQAMTHVLNSSQNYGKIYLEKLAENYFPKLAVVQQLVKGIRQPVLAYSSTGLTSLNGSIIISISALFKVKYYLVDFILGAVITAVNSATLLVCISLQILTVMHRHKNSVKKNSPLLLHISYIGIYSVNITGTIYVVQKIIPISSDAVYVGLCQVYWPVISVGITVVVGTLLVKSWRLYRIFVHYLNPGKLVSNKALVLVIFLLCLVDVLICSFWFILDPMKRSYKEISRDSATGSIIYFAGCRSRTSVLTGAILSSYQAFLFLVTITLLVKARAKIPQAHLKLHLHMENLFGYIATVSTLLFSITYASTSAFGLPLAVEVTALSLLIICAQYCCICLIFLPPLLPIICIYKQHFSK